LLQPTGKKVITVNDGHQDTSSHITHTRPSQLPGHTINPSRPHPADTRLVYLTGIHAAFFIRRRYSQI
ncbi:TPA: hypothetical protein ACX37D_004921, partial [Serratia marcescens]